MRLITLFLLIVSDQTGFSQVSIDSISYQNDLAIYRQALEQSHPSLYRFTPIEKYDALFDSIRLNLSDKTTELNFFDLSLKFRLLFEKAIVMFSLQKA